MPLSFEPNVMCRPTRNAWFVNIFVTVQTSKRSGKKLAVGQGILTGGGSPMVQPAQWLIRHWASTFQNVMKVIQSCWVVLLTVRMTDRQTWVKMLALSRRYEYDK